MGSSNVYSLPNSNKNKKQAAQKQIARAVLGAARSTVKKMPASPEKQATKLALGALSAGPKKVGGYIGGRIAKLSGRGDYTETNIQGGDVKVNSLMVGAPQLGTFDNQGSIRVKHREFLNDVISGPVGLFSNSYVYNVNPGLHAFSPFLSAIAANYEKYAIRGMVFEFVSATSPYASSGSLGTWMMAMEYNAASTPFTSKLAMENSDQCISARLDHCGMYGIECKPGSFATDWLYIRSALNPVAIPTGTPINFVDAGLFQFAMVSSIPPGLNMGELWVSYDIELSNPRLQTIGALDNVLYLPYTSFSAEGAFNTPATIPKYVSNDWQPVLQQTFLGATYQQTGSYSASAQVGDGSGVPEPSGILTVPAADNQLTYFFDIVYESASVDPATFNMNFTTNSDWFVTYVTFPSYEQLIEAGEVPNTFCEVRVDYVGLNGGRFQTPLVLGFITTFGGPTTSGNGAWGAYIRGSAITGGGTETSLGASSKMQLKPFVVKPPRGGGPAVTSVGAAILASDDRYAAERKAHGRVPAGRL